MKIRLRVLTNDEHEEAIGESGYMLSLVHNIGSVGEQPSPAYGVLEQSLNGQGWSRIPVFINK